MAVGTYTGQVIFSANGVTSVTVSVTLVIAPVTGTFFDNTPGQVSFSMLPSGQPPPQVLQIRNGGAGTLNWTLTSSTFNGASWISVSSVSGTAPSVITVEIVTANLPGGGATAGTYSGQLLIQTSGGASIVTVPIGLTVSANAMPQVNALSFSKPFAGANPLPQTVTIASGGSTQFDFSISSQTATGSTSGTWLSTSPTGIVCCVSPRAVTMSPVPAVTLAAGTYTGQVLADNGTQLMVIPVTLNVGAASSAFFDNVTGQLSFFLQTAAANAPPSQLIQIRNAGTGTLNWTLAPTTFDSSNWLTVSDVSDTAPTQISVGIVPANLPNGALTAGIYTANLLFQSGSSSVTVPITLQVGPSFEQVNGVNFTMLQTGPDPLPQNITMVSTGSAFDFSVDYSTATGGSWLTVSPSGAVCCQTPKTLEVSVTAPPTLPAGTYTAEIVVYSASTSLTVPVTLTVASSTNPYFDNLPGEMTFSMQTGATQPPSSQVFQIRNAGSGTLNWTITPTTSDGGNWLTVSAPNGTAPEIITVAIVPADLPNGGLVAGVFVGQLLLQGGRSSVTIPVSVDVGTTVFGQVNGIDFTMLQTGANPLPQVLTVTSTGTNFAVSVFASTATGGNWLAVSPSGSVCCETPRTLTVTVTASPTMAAGIYTGQVSIYSGAVSQTVPVTLTVAAAGTPFFDNVPGALSYSLVTGGGNPASQNVQIRNAGPGTLSWTAQVFTSDGGNWLTVSAPSGTAPSLLSIGIVTANLPNQGLVAGLFTGQVLFLAGNNSSVTVPVSVLVGGNGFAQVNGINFTMPLAGANPLPQTLTATSIGAAFDVSISAATANGGSWMTVAPSGSICCQIPDVLTVTVSAPAGLAAGSYTGEVIVDASSSAMVIPVTLTVAPSTSPFFDNVQGQMSFFAATSATPASQTMQLRNLGGGDLPWTLTSMTADTGNWLTLSATSGTTPSSITVGINPQNLPSQGLVAGQFLGQLLFQSSSSAVSVPVSVQLGPNIFTQMTGLSFSMPYGGGNPASQKLTVSSSGTAFVTSNNDASGNGGIWLSVAPIGSVCCQTPESITFNVNGAPGGTPVPVGIHTGQAVFIATHSAMTIPVTLTVQPAPLTVTAGSPLTVGEVNVAYNETLAASGGTPPYLWSMTAGAQPPGLSLSAAGVLSNTPTTAGTYNFTVTVTDSLGAMASASLQVVINPALGTTTTSPMPPGEVSLGYAQTIAASGGTSPYSWAINAGMVAPPGLSLSSAGVLSGTPGASGTYTFSVTVTDSLNAGSSASFQVAIAPALAINTTSLPPFQVNAPYSLTLSASGGWPPYNWSVTGLPSTISLASGGQLTGTPTATGSYNLTECVADSLGASVCLPPFPVSSTWAYLVGDVYPYSSDYAPNFGEWNPRTGFPGVAPAQALTIQDLVAVLFAANNISTAEYARPVSGTDRFDAMDTFPKDTSGGPGGDGCIDDRDVVVELFRFNNLDLSRPIRSSPPVAKTCPNNSRISPQDRSDVTTPSPPSDPDGTLIFGDIARFGGDEERMPVYLNAVHGLSRITLTFGLGDQQSPLRFVATKEHPPSLAHDKSLGVVAVVWAEGLSVPAGERLLLGYIEGPVGALTNVRMYGWSASGLDDFREVVIDVPQAVGRRTR